MTSYLLMLLLDDFVITCLRRFVMAAGNKQTGSRDYLRKSWVLFFLRLTDKYNGKVVVVCPKPEFNVGCMAPHRAKSWDSVDSGATAPTPLLLRSTFLPPSRIFGLDSILCCDHCKPTAHCNKAQGPTAEASPTS